MTVTALVHIAIQFGVENQLSFKKISGYIAPKPQQWVLMTSFAFDLASLIIIPESNGSHVLRPSSRVPASDRKGQEVQAGEGLVCV